MKGGKYLLGGFLCKSSLYSIITVSNNFLLGIDYYDDSLRTVNLFYLAKVKWMVSVVFSDEVTIQGKFIQNFQLSTG